MKRVLLFFVILICEFGGFMFTVRTIHPHRESIETVGEADALRAFDWWYNQRALPDGLIPNQALMNASSYLSRSMPKEQYRGTSAVTTAQWNSIGPNNIGGRVLSIAVDPRNSNIVWVGSASGGLWKSTTGGVGPNPWTYVNTGFPSLCVSAVAIDTSNPNVMYIGTGEISRYARPLIGVVGARASYGLGILKSSDGGATWKSTGLTYTFPQITAIERIVINPLNTKTIYAATSEGTFKTTNAGTTWTQSHSVLMAMDIVINPIDTNILFASYGNLNSTVDPGIYRTDDAGGTWMQLTNGLPSTNFGRTALAISRTSPSIVFAGVSNAVSGSLTGLFKTTNSGVSWSQVSSTNYAGTQGWYANVLAVDPSNTNNLYAGGLDVYRSTHGGTSLNNISGAYVHVDQHAITFDPSDPQVMYFGCDGGMYKSTDGGVTFLNLNVGFVTTQFYPGFSNFSGDSAAALGGLQDNGTLKFDGGLTWGPVLGADGGWTAINQTNRNIIYGEYQDLVLFKSTDGGASFTNIQTGLANAGTNFISPFVISYSNPSVLYAGSLNVYKTTNSGANWFASNGQSSLNGTNIACIGVSYTSPDTLLAGTGTGVFGATPLFQIFASTNGGAAWTNVTGSLPNRYPTDIEFDPTNSSTAYLTYSGYGTRHVFKTTNVGQTWIIISSNLPDIPHQTVVVDPVYPNHLYVGTDLGVYASTDGGITWSDYNNGMPTAMIQDLTISRANDMLRAATFGSGVYERRLPRVATLALTNPHGGEVFIAETVEQINWAAKYINAVKLEFSTNNGVSWTSLSDSAPAAAGSYAWTLPLVRTTQARVRISDAASGQLVATSGPFSILENPDVVSGWNLISLHATPVDARKIVLFPAAVSDAFAYSGSYVNRDTLQPGVGYWLKFDVPAYLAYTGDSLKLDSIHVKAGWNMIGALSSPVAASSIVQVPPAIVISPYFAYQGGYVVKTTLDPKLGFWVKVNANGLLILQSNSIEPKSQPNVPQENLLTFVDKIGNHQTLYFTSSPPLDHGMRFELPPTPPPGSFDVRFSGNRFLQQFDKENEAVVKISAPSYPVAISWQRQPQDYEEYVLTIDGTSIRLQDEGSFQLRRPPETISLKKITMELLPSTFALKQNFPNPFNPSTVIRYQIPSSGNVTLEIYNILGEVVTTLVQGYQVAGYQSVEWNARDLPTGIYFCKLTAGSFEDVKKMLLVR